VVDPTLGVNPADINPGLPDQAYDPDESVMSDTNSDIDTDIDEFSHFMAEPKAINEPFNTPGPASHQKEISDTTETVGKVSQTTHMVNVGCNRPCQDSNYISRTQALNRTRKKAVSKGIKGKIKGGHSNARSRHPCPKNCGMTFERQRDALRHGSQTKSCGGGEKRWECEHCSKKFPRKDAMRRHQGLTGSRPTPACSTLKSLIKTK